MRIIERALSAIGYERRAVSTDPYWSNFTALRDGSVTPHTAEGLSAVCACVSAISETNASLPLQLYKRADNDVAGRLWPHGPGIDPFTLNR